MRSAELSATGGVKELVHVIRNIFTVKTHLLLFFQLQRIKVICYRHLFVCGDGSRNWCACMFLSQKPAAIEIQTVTPGIGCIKLSTELHLRYCTPTVVLTFS